MGFKAPSGFSSFFIVVQFDSSFYHGNGGSTTDEPSGHHPLPLLHTVFWCPRPVSLRYTIILLLCLFAAHDVVLHYPYLATHNFMSKYPYASVVCVQSMWFSSSCNSISLNFLHSGQKYSVSQIVTNSVCRVSGFKCSLCFFISGLKHLKGRIVLLLCVAFTFFDLLCITWLHMISLCIFPIFQSTHNSC